MWARRPRAGAPSQPGVAGSTAVTTPNSLSLTSRSPSSLSSRSSSRASSHWQSVLGLLPVPSADWVFTFA